VHVAVGVTCKGAWRGGVYVWDTRDSAQRVADTIELGSAVDALAVLPDGLLVAGCANGKLRVVNAHRGAVVATHRGHAAGIKALAVLPGGRLVSASADGTARVWNTATWSCLATLTGHTKGVTSLAVLPDGRIATGSDDNFVRVWDASSGTCLGALTKHWGPVCALAVLADGRLASASHGGRVRGWDTRDATASVSDGSTRRAEMTVSGEDAAPRSGISLAPLPDGRLATGGEGVHLWRVPAAT